MAEPVQVQFDQSKFTFRELDMFEKIAGVPVASLDRGTVPSMAMLVAMTYLVLRKDDPSIKLDDVWDMNLENVEFVPPDRADPTAAEPTPLKPLEAPAPTATRRAKAS